MIFGCLSCPIEKWRFSTFRQVCRKVKPDGPRLDMLGRCMFRAGFGALMNWSKDKWSKLSAVPRSQPSPLPRICWKWTCFWIALSLLLLSLGLALQGQLLVIARELRRRVRTYKGESEDGNWDGRKGYINKGSKILKLLFERLYTIYV